MRWKHPYAVQRWLQRAEYRWKGQVRVFVRGKLMATTTPEKTAPRRFWT